MAPGVSDEEAGPMNSKWVARYREWQLNRPEPPSCEEEDTLDVLCVSSDEEEDEEFGVGMADDGSNLEDRSIFRTTLYSCSVNRWDRDCGPSISEALPENDQTFELLQREVDGLSLLVEHNTPEKLRNLKWADSVSPDGDTIEDGPDLFSEEPSFTEAAANSMVYPLTLFLFFLPITFWENVAAETNRYARRKVRGPFRDVTVEELFVFLGLCISRALQPMKTGLRHHWQKSSHSLLPDGWFGMYMPEKRFLDICRYLHFVDNEDARSHSDHLWKLRPVVDTLNTSFNRAYLMGGRVCFTEGSLPHHSLYNPKWLYTARKPDRWGATMFMVCCAETSFCHRFEIYLGKHPTRWQPDGPEIAGAAAVLRNVKYLRATSKGMKRVIIMDRFCSSVLLFIHLLKIGFYAVGSIMTSRLGFPKERILRYRDNTDLQGTTLETARCTDIPSMSAVAWTEEKPSAYLLSTGLSNRVIVSGEGKSAQKSSLPVTHNLKVYKQGMRAADRLEEMKAGSFSLQGIFAFHKWYIQVFLGLLDLVIANCYILWKMRYPKGHMNYMTRELFVSTLAEALLTKAENYRHLRTRRSSVSDGSTIPTQESCESHRMKHQLSENEQNAHGHTRQRNCVVCSALMPKTEVRTKYQCKACDVGLCRTVRWNDHLTCSFRFHNHWDGDKKTMRQSIRDGYPVPSLMKKRKCDK